MAKMQFFDLFGPNKSIVNYLFFDDFVQLADNYTSRRAIFEDSVGGSQLVLSGKDFEYNVAGDSLVAGKITSIAFRDEQGHNYLTFNDLKANAAGFNAAYDQGHPDFLVAYLLRGKDIITGSNVADLMHGYVGQSIIHGRGGDDTVLGNNLQDLMFGDGGNDSLTGAEGNDRMTGGKGSDSFFFAGISGDDVITDFDAKGGGDLQDYLWFTENTEFTAKRAGGDVLITFVDGDSIRLLDVAFRDFDADTDMRYVP